MKTYKLFFLTETESDTNYELLDTFTEEEVDTLLTENSFLKSILLMVLNNSETWENEHEVEFDRNGAVHYLKECDVFKGYDKKFIEKSLSNLIQQK